MVTVRLEVLAEIDDRCGPLQAGRQRDRPLEEMRRAVDVTPNGRSLRRAVQRSRGIARQRSGAIVRRAELAAIPVGLLEVVAEDLLVVVRVVRRDLRQPPGEALVQVGSLFLRHRLVGRVADQEVSEPERVLAGELGAVGADQFLPREREQARADMRAAVLRARARSRRRYGRPFPRRRRVRSRRAPPRRAGPDARPAAVGSSAGP